MTNDRDRTQPLIDPGAGREETSQTNGGMVATAFGLTDVGMQRSVNQDTLGNRVGQHAAQAPTLGLLYAVADGMGGHARGEVASALAIQHLFARYYSTEAGEDPRRGLERVLLETNAAVHQAGRDAGGASMGTTLTLALLRDGALYVGNIGDSRTYRVRNGQIEQLTHDHSLIGEQVRSGLLTENQARQSSIRNVITRAVGYREEVEPDVFTYPVMVGDIVLLCSDGLHSMVDSQELAQHLSTQPLGVAVPALIELAKQRGGPDNITALAVRIDGLAPAARSREDAVTVPMTPSLNDAVTKPFVRAEGEAAGGGDSGAATAGAVATAPMPHPPPPPHRSAPPPTMPPAMVIPPSPAPPPARSSSACRWR
ncbi:MAG: PP2C family serine/threonine-protein phosphatase [Chloroflexia bacterium]